MNDTPMPPAVAALAADRPYFALVGELVADSIALAKAVEAARPDSTAIDAPYLLSVDFAAGTVLLAKQLGDGRVVIVERIHANPQDSGTFGVSDLPVVEPDYGRVQ